MTKVIVVRCDGPGCKNSLEAATHDPLEVGRRNNSWVTVTRYQFGSKFDSHFCSDKCLRLQAVEDAKGIVFDEK